MARKRVAKQLTTRLAVEPAAGPLLDVDELRTGFHTPFGTAWAVDGVSFALERGKTLGIVGESGSGKTVLARTIMGLLPRDNTERSGRILFQGRDLAGLDDAELRHIWGAEIAMVFQDPLTSLNPVVKIGRQITESLRFHLDIRGDEARKIAVELLRSVRIPEPERRLTSYPHELSGGMRQRVCIAIALACGPRLLVADEPTTALDVTVQAQILSLLRQQQSDRHMAMMLITHDLGVVAGRADNVIVMYAGQVVEQAPTRALFGNMRMPYTEALFTSIPRLDTASHTRLTAIAGRPPSLVAPPSGCRFAPRCPYVQERCRREMPPLIESETPGHLYRCWYPVGGPGQGPAAERENGRRQPATDGGVTEGPSGDAGDAAPVAPVGAGTAGDEETVPAEA
jgi:oligopeptide/dipeptide ABC transporter ATP-binding protein